MLLLPNFSILVYMHYGQTSLTFAARSLCLLGQINEDEIKFKQVKKKYRFELAYYN